MKRILMLTLALILAFSTAACGNANGDEPKQPSTTDTSELVSESETEFFPNVARQDYQGKEFCMIGFTAPGEWYYAEKTGGGVINDAIYAMNIAVEDYLKVDITYWYVTPLYTIPPCLGVTIAAN